MQQYFFTATKVFIKVEESKPMRKFFESTAHIITNIIDFFYPLCRKWCSPQFFRYGVCGAGNMVLDWVLYFIVYNFILQHRMLHLGFVTLSSHIATLCVVFPITLLTGFYLSKYVTFTNSNLRGKVQLIRYIAIVLINLLVNYAGLKLFVDVCGIYPTPSKMLITVITVTFSYFAQKYFTFK